MLEYSDNTMIYQISNLNLDIEIEDLSWEVFENQLHNGKIDCYIRWGKEMEIHGISYSNFKTPFFHLSQIGSNIMASSRGWENNVIFLKEKKEEIIDCFLLELFYIHAVQQNMLQFHSSLIEHQGCGLMFLGPSGIGKTTQAELWNQYRDALIINGDVVFVQETPDAFLGWGTPWHGSSPYCENTSVPVKALIVLKQAPENSIRELTGFEKVTAVSNNVFYPRWLENGMELCLETLNHLLSALPVYELSCRPDEEAVRLTEEAVFGK